MAAAATAAVLEIETFENFFIFPPLLAELICSYHVNVVYLDVIHI